MPYSIYAMRAALETIWVRKGKPFDEPFEGTDRAHPSPVHPDLQAKFFKKTRDPRTNSDILIPTTPHRNYLNDLLEYCWIVYSKALQAKGPQLTGRQGELWVPMQFDKVGIQNEKTDYLWKDFTKGNILNIDKWSPTVNDCWVLGGVHRQADFELVSKEVIGNLWKVKENYHVVWAREILGVLHFGYKYDHQMGQHRLVCKDPEAASSASIEEYDEYMQGMQAKGPDSVQELLTQGLFAEIRTFDKGTLKHVEDPLLKKHA